jgi:hypothetical protein
VELQKNFGFKLISSRNSPESYAENPLASKDATACFLHFSELGLPYALHVFQKCDQVPSVPIGHTAYSWGESPDASARTPVGHTRFSWGGTQTPC